MKSYILFGLLIICFTLTGCFESPNYNYVLNSSSSGQCVKDCADLMNDGHCMSSTPNYREQNTIINGIISNNTNLCECTLIQCFSVPFNNKMSGVKE